MPAEEYLKATLDRHLIYRCVTGSRAYQTHTPASDYDIRGVYILPERLLLSPFHKLDHIQIDGEDTHYYELRNFMSMIAKQNWNILELLWIDQDHVQHETEAWKLLKQHRGDLLSKEYGKRISAFARNQLNKLISRREWFENPKSEEPPLARDFVVIDRDLTGGQHFQKNGMPRKRDGYRLIRQGDGSDQFLLCADEAAQWHDSSGALCWSQENPPEQAQALAVVSFNRALYEADRKEWKQYWEWKRNRSKDRGILQDRLGYDTKDATHLLRLLFTAREAMDGCSIRLVLAQASFLKDVRRGVFAFDDIVSWTQDIHDQLQEAIHRSELPEKVNIGLMEDILVRMHRNHRESLDEKTTPTPSNF